jgi:hypothetical protein
MRKNALSLIGLLSLLVVGAAFGQEKIIPGGTGKQLITIVVKAPQGVDSVLVDCNKELDSGWVEGNAASSIGDGSYSFDCEVTKVDGLPFVFNASYVKSGRRVWVTDPSCISVNGTTLDKSFLRKKGEANWWVRFE